MIAKRRTNMKKTAVIIAPGCEEGEALTIVDIFRRAELHCEMAGLCAIQITGAHGITMMCDRIADETLREYDMIVLPGGYEGTDAMAGDETLLSVLKDMDKDAKLIGAMCAAPCVLDKAGILRDRRFTCYPGVRDKITSGIYVNEKTVRDENIITGQGPAMAWAFAYRLVDALGGDSLTVKKRMVYFNAFDVKEDE